MTQRPLLLAILAVVLSVIAAERPLLSGLSPVTQDAVIQFYPWHQLTMQLLRAGCLPVWNPYQLAGAPLLADPQSGWGNLPLMLAYLLVPAADAEGLALALQMMLAALGMLLFLQSSGTGVLGSILAALAYGLGGTALSAQPNVSWVGVAAWLPWLFLGIYLGVRCLGPQRWLGWSLTGFATSQIIASWFGQGAYYALFAAVTYLTYLAWFDPGNGGGSIRERIRRLIIDTAIFAACVLLFSAWTLFPRIELLLSSNLSGGYGPAELQFNGGGSIGWLTGYYDWTGSYVGASVILAVCAAPFFVLRARRVAYFAGMCLVTYLASLTWLVDLARSNATARSILGYLPGVLQLHLHAPHRIAMVYVFFGCALAGIVFEELLKTRHRLRLALPLAVTVAVAALGAIAGLSALGLPRYRVFEADLAIAVLLVAMGWIRPNWTRAAGVVIVVILSAELVYHAYLVYASSVPLGQPSRYYEASTTRTSVAALRSVGGTARFFGYYPPALPHGSAAASDTGYRKVWRRPAAAELLLDTQSVPYELRDVQGYNPVHLSLYDQWLATANQTRLQYRNGYILTRALHSPLLDMLNVGHVLAYSGTRLGRKYVPVAQAGRLSVFENTRALPEAWVVHSALSADDLHALRMIDAGQVDPRITAVVAHAPPELRPARGPEEVSVEAREPDAIALNAYLSAPGLVVLSEFDYPAWKVAVDGKPTRVVRADGVLRSVFVPAGQHSVVWRFDSTPTTIGILVSLAALLLSVTLLLAWGRLRSLVSRLPRRYRAA